MVPPEPPPHKLSTELRAIGAPMELLEDAVKGILGQMDVPPSEEQLAEIRRILLKLSWATYNGGYARGRAAP